jgi:hypothetical protein
MRRTYSQIKQEKSLFVTIINTTWLYPESDITLALANTTYRYTFDGGFIICPDLTNLIGVYGDIFNRTAVSQPVDNSGFTLGVGTLLEDMGKEIRFKLDGGETVIVWRLVRQLTPQQGATVIPVRGNSPNGTIGYVTTFLSYGTVPSSGPAFNVLDDVHVLQIG